MKNVIILGSGRSGTSMLAGCFHNAGYFMGDNLLNPNAGNPKGLYEDTEVNLINEELLAPSSPKPFKLFDKLVVTHHPIHLQRWLLVREQPLDQDAPEEIRTRIARLVSRTPYCFKDPRFSYTLPVWERYIADTIFIVVFRSPLLTAQSIVQECNREIVLQTLKMTNRRAVAIWLAMYSCILQQYRNNGSWLFVHYDQVINGSAIDSIEKVTGSRLDRGFPEPALNRSKANRRVPRTALGTYKTLCDLARYTPSMW